MPFPVQKDMDENAFKTQIIDYYWTDELQAKITKSTDTPSVTQGAEPKSLVEDLGKIGAFLTKKDHVLRALIPLERELRQHATTQLNSALSGFNAQAPAYIKSNKLLSGVLERHELMTGFNNPELFYQDAQAKLHSEAHVAQRNESNEIKIKEGLPELEKVGLSKSVTLPTGIPRAMGNVAGRDFNRILLRHGYQFKDVGAGIDHGEFTHRLQWYALAHANLGLTNPLPYIYRSLGSLWAKGVDNIGNSNVYLWEAIFDCFPSAQVATQQKSLAYSMPGCCNCPDNLNMELSGSQLNTLQYDGNDPANLWCLRVLLTCRRNKRLDENRRDVSYFDKVKGKIQGGRRNYAESYISPPKENERAGLGGMLVWYLNN